MFSYPNLHSRDPLLVGRSQSKELSSELQCNASLDAVLESVTRDSHVQNLATSKRDGCDRRARLCRRREIWRRFSNVADFSADFAFDVFALFDAGRSHSGKRRLQCG